MSDIVMATSRRIGAVDVLVFRRVERDRWAHLGGRGRGESWAGIVELHVEQEPLLARALASGAIHRHESDHAVHVVGPYHSPHAALVPVGHDHLVVFGWPSAPPEASVDDALLHAAARTALAEVGEISPAKRLTDEMELLHALQALLAEQPETLDGALEHVATVAADALSCELVVIADHEHDRVAVHAQQGFDLGVDRARRLLDALPRTEGLLCIQDADAHPLPDALGGKVDVSSWCLLPLGEPAFGRLLMAHADTSPRGFTTLCRQLVQRLAEAGGGVLQAAAMRDRLREEIARVGQIARRDTLTGLGNRLAWEEALARVQRTIDEGTGASVLVLDVDNLKAVNDTAGHDQGDQLLVLIAQLLRDVVREGDVIARIGGDEFAVLLPDTNASVRDQVAERLRAAITAAPKVAGFTLSVSVGSETCPPGGQLSESLAAADGHMYAEKGRR